MGLEAMNETFNERYTAPKASKPSNPVNIPLSDVSPEFKRLVVTELIRTGKARVIRGKKKDMMKK